MNVYWFKGNINAIWAAVKRSNEAWLDEHEIWRHVAEWIIQEKDNKGLDSYTGNPSLKAKRKFFPHSQTVPTTAEQETPTSTTTIAEQEPPT